MVKQHLHSATRPFATLFSLLTLAVLGASLTVVGAELLSPVAQAAESARRTQAEQQIRQDAEQQAQQARQEAEQLAQQARQEAEQQARQARQEAEQQAQQARQEAEQQARQARQEAEQRAQQTTQRVRQAEQQALQVETLSRQVDQQALQVEQQAIRIAQHEQQVESEARQVESEARQVEQQAEQLAQVSGQVAQQAQEVERQVQQLTQLAQPTRSSREQAQQLVQVPEQRAQAARAERRVRTQGWPGSSRARAPEEAATAAIDVVTGGVLADAIEFLNMKQFAEARERLGDLQPNRLSPFEQSRYYQLMFNIEMNDENYPAAREQLELAIATGGLNAQENSRSRYQLAQLFVQEEKYAEASAALEEWIAAEPAPNSAAYYLLAASYNYQDLVERALPHAQRAVDLADGSPNEAWLGLLFALNIKLERLDAAEDTAAEMVKLFPDNATYRTQLEQLKAQNARR